MSMRRAAHFHLPSLLFTCICAFACAWPPTNKRTSTCITFACAHEGICCTHDSAQTRKHTCVQIHACTHRCTPNAQKVGTRRYKQAHTRLLARKQMIANIRTVAQTHQHALAHAHTRTNRGAHGHVNNRTRTLAARCADCFFLACLILACTHMHEILLADRCKTNSHELE